MHANLVDLGLLCSRLQPFAASVCTLCAIGHAVIIDSGSALQQLHKYSATAACAVVCSSCTPTLICSRLLHKQPACFSLAAHCRKMWSRLWTCQPDSKPHACSEPHKPCTTCISWESYACRQGWLSFLQLPCACGSFWRLTV